MLAPRLALAALLPLFLLTSVATSFAAADDDIPSPDAKSAAEIVDLIQQLGDESYASREAATEKLLTYGLPALKLVEEGAKDPDREVRYRCERVRIMLREIDLQRRLEAFAADIKGEKDHGLPAWNRFAELHGSGGDSRQLFVDIFRAEPELLKALQIDPKQAGDLVASRIFQLQQLMQAQQQIGLGTIAGLLFAAAEPNVTIPDNSQQMIYSFCHQQSLRDAVTTGGGKQPVVRSLLAKYIVRGEGHVAYQGLYVAMQYDIKEGLEPARKLVKGRGAGNAHLMQLALLAIAKMGGSEDVKDMGELLEDKQVIMNFQINNQRIECQVRDFALLSTLHLLAKDKERVKGTAIESGDLKAFGFDRLEANAMQLYAPHTVGFTSDQKRQEVFKKWEEVKAKIAEKKPDEKK
jgi:hypothetical protein